MAWQGGGSRLVQLDRSAAGPIAPPRRSRSRRLEGDAAPARRAARSWRCRSTCPATRRSPPRRSRPPPHFERAFQARPRGAAPRGARRCVVAHRRRLRHRSPWSRSPGSPPSGAAVTRFERRNAGPRVTLQPPCRPRVGRGMRRVLVIAVALVAFAAPAGDCGGQDQQGGQAGGEAGVPRRARRRPTRRARRSRRSRELRRTACIEKAREAKAERKAARSERGAGVPRGARRHRREPRGVPRQVRHQREQAATRSASASRRRPRRSGRSRTRRTPPRRRSTKNAAQECDAERSADRKAFEDKYGTNHNKKNAFGKCVSQKVARGQRGGRPAAPEPTWQCRRAGSSPWRAASSLTPV